VAQPVPTCLLSYMIHSAENALESECQTIWPRVEGRSPVKAGPGQVPLGGRDTGDYLQQARIGRGIVARQKNRQKMQYRTGGARLI
jgi:hypothetical protein